MILIYLTDCTEISNGGLVSNVRHPIELSTFTSLLKSLLISKQSVINDL